MNRGFRIGHIGGIEVILDASLLIIFFLLNPFRIRAYRNAARVVGDLGVDVQAMIASARPAGAGWRRTMCSIRGHWPNCANCSEISRAGYRDGQEH